MFAGMRAGAAGGPAGRGALLNYRRMSSETPQTNAAPKPGTAATAAPAEKPPLNIEIEWRGDLRFQGEIDGKPSLMLDSDSKEGAS